MFVSPIAEDAFYYLSKEDNIGEIADCDISKGTTINYQTISELNSGIIFMENCDGKSELCQEVKMFERRGCDEVPPPSKNHSNEENCMMMHSMKEEKGIVIDSPFYVDYSLFTFSKSIEGFPNLPNSSNPVEDFYYLTKNVLHYAYYVTKNNEIFQSNYEYSEFKVGDWKNETLSIICTHKKEVSVAIQEDSSFKLNNLTISKEDNLIISQETRELTSSCENTEKLKIEIMKDFRETIFVIKRAEPFNEMKKFSYLISDTSSNEILIGGILDLEETKKGFAFTQSAEVVVDPASIPIIDQRVKIGNVTHGNSSSSFFKSIQISFQASQRNITLLRKSTESCQKYEEIDQNYSSFLIKNPRILLEKESFMTNISRFDKYKFAPNSIFCGNCDKLFGYEEDVKFQIIGESENAEFIPYSYTLRYQFEMEMYDEKGDLLTSFVVEMLEEQIKFLDINAGINGFLPDIDPDYYPIIVVLTSIAFVGSTFSAVLIGSSVVGTVVVRKALEKKYQNSTVLKLEEYNKPKVMTVPLIFGKYVKTNEGKCYQVLDTSYKMINKNIELKPKTKIMLERKFEEVLRGIRASKFALLAHCKQCFLEQMMCNRKKIFGENTDEYCCKCGLPLMPFLEFKKDEMFCIVCALNFRYDNQNHGRCLLHHGNKKKVGEYYSLYKTEYSVSAASKKKKDSPSLQRLTVMISDDLWHINSVMRFDYLKLIQRLIGKELFVPYVNQQTIEDIKLTIEDIKKKEILVRKDCVGYYKDKISAKAKKILKKRENEYVENFCSLLKKTIVVLKRQLALIQLIKKKMPNEQSKEETIIAPPRSITGNKRKFSQIIQSGNQSETNERKKRKINSHGLSPNSTNSSSFSVTSGEDSDQTNTDDWQDILKEINLESDKIIGISSNTSFFNDEEFGIHQNLENYNFQVSTDFDMNDYIQNQMEDANVFHFDNEI